MALGAIEKFLILRTGFISYEGNVLEEEEEEDDTQNAIDGIFGECDAGHGCGVNR